MQCSEAIAHVSGMLSFLTTMCVLDTMDGLRLDIMGIYSHTHTTLSLCIKWCYVTSQISVPLRNDFENNYTAVLPNVQSSFA